MSRELLDRSVSRLRATMRLLAVGVGVFLAAPIVLTFFQQDVSTAEVGLLFAASLLCLTGFVRLAKVTQQLAGN